MMPLEDNLQQARSASYVLAVLTTQQKNQALKTFARLIRENIDQLLEANQEDYEREKAQLSSSMLQRLKLDKDKISQLVQGIEDVANLPDPVGAVLSKTKLDEGLVLEKMSVPLGVVGIIFESRPDVIPQILALALKSGNAVVLKGGKEATASNQAFMGLVSQLNAACPWLPPAWAQLLESREAVHDMLNYPQYVDLVIPRGSNQLVQSIMAATKIPVLGHADGVCHLYVHPSADMEKAVSVVVDSKAQYPAACNALETLLVDAAIADVFLPKFQTAALLAGIQTATEEDWQTEYGDLTLAVKVVSGLEEAISHINHYGSHHTDGILATEPEAIETFLNQVDSASVFANCSTRFADGFRFGLGAEIGISTAKTHARGPVGLEGLVIYKYKLRGEGQVVKDYTGPAAKPFLHHALE